MDDTQQQGPKESKISNTTGALMVATAGILDLISIIPVVGQALASVGSFVIFLIWFLILGLPLVTPKKLLTTLSAYVIEIIPAISALPAITVGVILMIVLTRAEEKTGIQLLDKKGVPTFGTLAKAGSAVRTAGKMVPKSLPHMNDMLPSET